MLTALKENIKAIKSGLPGLELMSLLEHCLPLDFVNIFCSFIFEIYPTFLFIIIICFTFTLLPACDQSNYNF